MTEAVGNSVGICVGPGVTTTAAELTIVALLMPPDPFVQPKSIMHNVASTITASAAFFPFAIVNLPLSTFNFQLSTCNFQLATYHLPLSTFNLPLATCHYTVRQTMTTFLFCLAKPSEWLRILFDRNANYCRDRMRPKIRVIIWFATLATYHLPLATIMYGRL